jgi:hypothetical protein
MRNKCQLLRVSTWGIERTGSSCSSDSQSEHLHGHGTVALPSVDTGVIGEDIGHGLRHQVVRVGQGHFVVV